MAKWPQRLCVVTAVPLLAFGCAEVIVGALVYNFTLNIKIGAWYVGVFAIITALVGFGAHFHTAFSGMYPIMCMLTATVALIGTLVDGIAYAVIGYIKACGNDGAHYWGDSDFYADALESCELPATSRDCYCVISHSSGCFSYDGNGKDTFDQDDCDPMIDEYPTLVLNSWSICLALFFLSWLIFFVGCCACCGNMFLTPEVKAPPPLTGHGPVQPNNPLIPPDVTYNDASFPPPAVAVAYVEPSAPPL